MGCIAFPNRFGAPIDFRTSLSFGCFGSSETFHQKHHGLAQKWQSRMAKCTHLHEFEKITQKSMFYTETCLDTKIFQINPRNQNDTMTNFKVPFNISSTFSMASLCKKNNHLQTSTHFLTKQTNHRTLAVTPTWNPKPIFGEF